ncbi:MAG TPA: hypothetical protein VGR89_05150, partial [Puia sp.]|nr:hypothetical protein [Puia sp.]
MEYFQMSMGGRTYIHCHLRSQAFTGLVTALFLILPLGGWGQATSPEQPPTASASGPSTTDLNVSPEEEIKILDAIDAQASTSTAQQTAPVSTAPSTPSAPPPANYAPPAAPTGLSVLILKEGIYLSWDAAPAGSAVTAYNVFRSTTPGGGYKKVNLKPVLSPYFLDSLQNSTSPPRNGEDYFYVVSASDSQGKTSPTSDEITVTPEGMEIPEEEASPTPAPTQEEREIALPEKNIVNLQLPA